MTILHAYRYFDQYPIPNAIKKKVLLTRGVGLFDEAVPVQVRAKGGWESKDSSPFVWLPMKVCS